MAIPDYQAFMLPLLKLASDGRQHAMREAFEILADEFSLTEEERTELLPSGRQPTCENRVGWAKTYLKKAGLLDSPKRGFFTITGPGQQVLAQSPPRIDRAFLLQYPEFVEFQRPKQAPDEGMEPRKAKSKHPKRSSRRPTSKSNRNWQQTCCKRQGLLSSLL